MSRVSVMAQSLYEPDPRYFPCSAVINGELCVWEGKTTPTTSLQIFHPNLESWRELPTRDDNAPPGLYMSASAQSKHFFYVYGGFLKDNVQYSGCLHRLDTKTSSWTQLAPHSADGPLKKRECGMIVYENSVIVIGGFGKRNGPIQLGSEWRKKNESDPDDDPNGEGTTNEVHMYNLKEKTWSSVTCTGVRPPPCCSFSVTMIDSHRAILFGGRQAGARSNDAYILDLTTMHWTRVSHKEGDPWPERRSFHAAFCGCFGGDRPQLIITGGIDADDNVLNDLWIMDVQSGKWNKVPIPNFQPRYAHCSAAFNIIPGTTEVVLFGGSTVLPLTRPDEVLADTIVLGFDYNPSNAPSNWILSDMADNKQRGHGKRIREKVSKLSQLARTSLGSKQEAETKRKEAERKLQEAEDKIQDLERMLEEMESMAAGEKHWVVQRKEIEMTEEVLDRGVWGEVKIANFKGVRVAAKVVHKHLKSPYYHSSFIQEMNIALNMASRIHHPNLVQFIGASMEEDILILMELMPTSIREHLATNAPAIPSAAFRISVSLDVAKALNYLHLMKPHPIIFHDITSANVLLEPLANEIWRAKLNMRQVQIECPRNSVYLSPEAHIPSLQSTKLDVFSFGVLLIEMCTAQFPHAAKRAAMIGSIKEREWVDMIQQCIHQEPNQRPKMSEIMTQLTSWQ